MTFEEWLLTQQDRDDPAGELARRYCADDRGWHFPLWVQEERPDGDVVDVLRAEYQEARRVAEMTPESLDDRVAQLERFTTLFYSEHGELLIADREGRSRLPELLAGGGGGGGWYENEDAGWHECNVSVSDLDELRQDVERLTAQLERVLGEHEPTGRDTEWPWCLVAGSHAQQLYEHADVLAHHDDRLDEFAARLPSTTVLRAELSRHDDGHPTPEPPMNTDPVLAAPSGTWAVTVDVGEGADGIPTVDIWSIVGWVRDEATRWDDDTGWRELYLSREGIIRLDKCADAPWRIVSHPDEVDEIVPGLLRDKLRDALQYATAAGARYVVDGEGRLADAHRGMVSRGVLLPAVELAGGSWQCDDDEAEYAVTHVERIAAMLRGEVELSYGPEATRLLKVSSAADRREVVS